MLVLLFKECKSPTIYYMISEDLCYDICPPRYYGNTTDLLCYSCPQYDCYSCGNTASTNNNCLTCNNTLDFRVLSGTRCIPIDGYYDDGFQNSTAQLCDLTLCKTCSLTQTNCTSCNDGFYLLGNTCNQCVSNCTNCTSLTNCLSCEPNFVNLITSCLNCSSILHCVSCNTSSC
jgi:hypothetical protein